MITIYQFDAYGYATGATKQQDEKTPIPQGWTHKEPVPGYRFVGNIWQDVPIPAPTLEEYKPKLLEAVDAHFAKNAAENEFRTVEEAIESYEQNDERWVSALLRDWRAQVKMDVRHHINEIKEGNIPAPSDLSFVSTLPDFDLLAVPFKVTARQAREALINQGIQDGDDKIAAINAYIDAIPDANQQALARNYWETSQDFERSNALLNTIATDALVLTQTQIDDLFRYAQKL
jgi:hypothetical protein